MTPEEKAKAYAEQLYPYPERENDSDLYDLLYYQIEKERNAFLAGYKASWEWIPITPETMPEPNVPLQLYYSLLHKPIYGLYDGENFVSAGLYGRLPKEHLTHFRYIPQDKPGEKS